MVVFLQFSLHFGDQQNQLPNKEVTKIQEVTKIHSAVGGFFYRAL